MYRFSATKGFTIIEVLVVITIIAIITAVSAESFQNMHRASTLRSATSEVYAALADARAKTLASQNDIAYGVHVSTSTVTRFEGSSYDAGSVTNKTYSFEGGVNATSSLITNGVDVVFTKLTGIPSAQGTIYVRRDDGGGTTTIVIYDSGLIESQ